MPPPAGSSSSAAALVLYRGWPTQGHHVWSPFVVKLEARLRFAGVRYECRGGNPLHAPRGKIPYVEIPPLSSASAPLVAVASRGGQTGRKGEVERKRGGEVTQMGDSGLITRHLVERGMLPDLNARLSPRQRELDLATRALLEDKLFFYHTRERWLENYPAMRDHVLSAIPWPARLLVGRIKHRGFHRSLYAQGTMRYSRREARAAKEEVWRSVSGALEAVWPRAGSRGVDSREPCWFLGGDGPTEVDATLFGFLVSVLECSAGPESRQIVGQHPILLNYAERIHERYFPDYIKWPAEGGSRIAGQDGGQMEEAPTPELAATSSS